MSHFRREGGREGGWRRMGESGEKEQRSEV